MRKRKGDSPSNVILHLNELCRLCLAKDEEMVPIYDEETIPLPLRIMACLNLEVSISQIINTTVTGMLILPNSFFIIYK